MQSNQFHFKQPAVPQKKIIKNNKKISMTENEKVLEDYPPFTQKSIS